MVRITVPDQQAEALRNRSETILLVDQRGNVIGSFSPSFSAEEVLEAKRRSVAELGGSTTAEVLARLTKLESK